MQLNFKRLGEGTPLIILHGLFGSLDNWMTFARAIAAKRTVYLVDQRNHGGSPHAMDHHYEAMADDLEVFFQSHQIEEADIIGHSMGGKTAMQFACEHPEKVKQLIVVDIAPKEYPVHHQLIIEALESIDLSAIKSRGQADEQMSKLIEDFGVRQFLLKGLARGPEGFRWKFNLEVIKDQIENIVVPLDAQSHFDGPSVFIRGARSNYILEEDFDGILRQFPHASFETIAEAGHWIHAEKPQAFLEVISKYL
ncbi:alpha/beta fold hydrolase [Persicobacter diffluens]|uniref:Alpha/beta hydrolase n=1 Tax=Persicobacter diffluens TaxID=981 RepID=A0AAN4VTJ5_9BACT|nr:alpha/beta hydrolase [Persicobacter diffluens]